MKTMSVVVGGAAAMSEDIAKSMAKKLASMAKDSHAHAQIMIDAHIEQSDVDNAQHGESHETTLQLSGEKLPSSSDVIAALRAEFPQFSAKDIHIDIKAGGPEHGTFERHMINGAELDEIIDQEAPEDAKQEIIDRLRAQGVEGEIDIQIDSKPSQGMKEIEMTIEHEQSE